MNNDNFLIEETDIELAREICKNIKNTDIRNRAVVNALAGNIAEKYFTEVEVDIKTGIHNISKVLEDVEIADIYVNGSYLDVRFYFEGDTLTIPKSLFDAGIKPIAYMFIKLQEDASGGLVTGFIQPEAISTETSIDGYYTISEDDLISFYDIQPLLITPEDIDIPDNFSNQIFDYLDNRLENTTDFYKLLLASEEAREELAIKANVQNIFNFVSFNDVDKSSVSNPEVEVANENSDLLESSSDEDSFATLTDEEDSVDLMSLDSDDASSFDMLEEDNSFELVSEEIDSGDEFLMANENDESITISDTFTEEDSIDTCLLEDSNSDIIELDPSNGLEEFQAEETSLLTIEESNSENITFSSLEEDNNLIQEAETLVEDTSLLETLEEAPSFENIEVQELNDLATSEPDSIETNIVELEDSEHVEEEQQSEFEFSTNVTPSISEYEEPEVVAQTEDSIEDDDTDLLSDDILETLSTVEEEPEAEEQVISEAADTDINVDSEQIDSLFDSGDDSDAADLSQPYIPNKSKNSPFGLILGILILLAGLGCAGYIGYTKFANGELLPDLLNNKPVVNDNYAEEEVQTASTSEKKSEPVAMPNETIENVKAPAVTNEGTAVSIPAIEQSLDASIQIENLRVNWEVPASYVSNTTIKRYFTKLGKIIQLRLKTELLLLTKQPISNKITVELQYDKNKDAFVVKGIVTSSGDTTVDKLVIDTVSKVLDMNLKVNTSSFKTLTGNPILVINL